LAFRLFLTAQRTAALRHDDDTLASLINRLLRSYVQYSLYDQADKLVSKTTFPASAGNPQYARYHYYLGRIRAVQLNYSEAHANLQQAIRRAPQATVAPGFYQAVHKLSVVVELLMGDIPDRGVFRHPVLQKALNGYFEIVRGQDICLRPKLQVTDEACSGPGRLALSVPDHTGGARGAVRGGQDVHAHRTPPAERDQDGDPPALALVLAHRAPGHLRQAPRRSATASSTAASCTSAAGWSAARTRVPTARKSPRSSRAGSGTAWSSTTRA
jgi:tetratricopeptide (TPR) repeat protein